jgi:phi LC3 family holin
MQINWKVRIANKDFWMAMIPAVLLLVQAIGAPLGLVLDFGELGNQLLAIVNAVFAVLAILGIVNDPTTNGMGDSRLAMTYEQPKKDV